MINDGSSTLKVTADSLSQLCAVVLRDSVRCGCRDILEFGIPKKTNKKTQVQSCFIPVGNNSLIVTVISEIDKFTH